MRSFAGLVAGVALLAPIAPLSAACCPPGFCATYDVNTFSNRLDGPAGPKKETKVEAIARRLAAPVTVHFDDVPLRKVIEQVRELAPDVNVVPDLPTLQEAGISLDSPVTLNLKQVPLKTALNAILRQVKLTFVVKDEVIFVTTCEASKGKRVTATYPVADLVVPIAPEIEGEVQPQFVPQSAPATSGNVTRITKEAALIKLIMCSISPASWSESGGTGTIEYFPLAMALVVSQTPDVQEQVQDLLAAVRRMQDVSVVTELRFVTVSDETFRKLGIDAQQNGATPAVNVLDDTQVSVLLKAVQADPAAAVMQAPKLTCFSGQKATVSAMDRHTFVTGVRQQKAPDGRMLFAPQTTTVNAGFQATVQPAASADRTQVTMNLGITITRLDTNRYATTPPCYGALQFPTPAGAGQAPATLTPYAYPQPRVNTFHAEATFKVPDGKTALLSGWTHQGEAHSDTTPRIAPVPYLQQLYYPVFPTVRKEHLLVLVAPRVVVTQEKEEKKCVSAEQEEPKPAEVLPAPETEEQGYKPVGLPCWEGNPPPPDGFVAPKPPAAVAYSNSRSLSLAYEVGNVGPSKLASIEVYFTHDGGQWQRYPDSVRPTGTVPITVAKDGRYGFILVARSNAGMAKPAPKAGDEPHLTVEVDAAAPEVRLDTPKVHYESHGVVNVRWEATDRNLADAPTSLEWAPTAAGPWKRIAKDLPACGSFHWEPKDVPGQVYLRLCVCDRAGNVGVRVTPEPVMTDLKVPEVLGVRLTR